MFLLVLVAAATTQPLLQTTHVLVASREQRSFMKVANSLVAPLIILAIFGNTVLVNGDAHVRALNRRPTTILRTGAFLM